MTAANTATAPTPDARHALPAKAPADAPRIIPCDGAGLVRVVLPGGGSVLAPAALVEALALVKRGRAS